MGGLRVGSTEANPAKGSSKAATGCLGRSLMVVNPIVSALRTTSTCGVRLRQDPIASSSGKGLEGLFVDTPDLFLLSMDK